MKLRDTVLAVAILLPGAAMATEVTVYGDESYPPYSFKEKGKMTGIYTVILEKIFSKMPDYTVTIKSLPWKRGLKQIESGDIFALYPPYERRKERPYMEYDMPILDEELVVFCQNKVLTSPRPNWPDDYFGLTIGNNAGFAAGGEAFWAAVKAGKIKVQETKGTPANLKKLIGGRVDCYMNDGLSIQWELKQLQAKGAYDGSSLSKGTTISAEQGYLGFATDGSKFPYKDSFKQEYLKQLKTMKESGELQQIVDQYLSN